jgi:general secretion pathway protein A
MYERHFGFREEPFGVTPDPKFLYCSPQHAEALAALHYGLAERRGLLVLTAGPGRGKTTLLYRLLEHWRERAEVAFLFRAPETREQLLAALLEDLGITPEPGYAQNWRRFESYALECRQKGRRLVLLFDEAQGLPDAVLEEIRLLSNLEAPEEKLVEIVLAGQPALAERLAAEGHEQFRQRVGVWAEIAPLDPADVRRYVDHRLRVAGRTRGRLLTRKAVAALADASGGIPRHINSICFEALSQTFAEGRKRINENALRQAAGSVTPPLEGPAAAHVRPAPGRPGLGWMAAAITAGVLLGALAANLYFPNRLGERLAPAWPFWKATSVSAAPPPAVRDVREFQP